VFRHDFQTGVTERASVDSAGIQANGRSQEASISADGRYVAFWSSADNLVANDTNSMADVFRHDFQTGVTERVSVDSSGVQANGECVDPSISGDGRFVAFCGRADNLVANDTNVRNDVFRHDFQTGVTERASVDSSGGQANGDSLSPSISADGRYVSFRSDANTLVANDTNGELDIFRHDFQSGVTERANVDSAGAQATGWSYGHSISADGRYVAFSSDADNLAANDTNLWTDVFRHDFQTGVTELLSFGRDTAPASSSSQRPAISADGRHVAFDSYSSNLVIGDTNNRTDVFLHETGTFLLSPICFGDGTENACPCVAGAPGRGCENSGGTGGALLEGTGEAFLSNDTLQLVASGERPTSLSLFWQGDRIPQRPFGDGLGCVGGQLRRLYLRNAVGGSAMAPQGAELSISARSAALGAPLTPSSVRVYQAIYRDGDPNYCAAPFGSTINATSGLVVLWRP
jgi:Tol biopolymer transport system component